MAYATKFTFDCVWRSFEEMRTKIAAGDFSMLPEVSLLKSSGMNGYGDFSMFNEFLSNRCFLSHLHFHSVLTDCGIKLCTWKIQC